MSGVAEIVKQIEYVPSIPLALSRVLRVIESPDATIQRVVDTVKFDATLSANLLKLCNSPLLGLRRSVSSLKEAMTYVGLAELKRMVLLILSQGAFARSYPGYEGRHGELLRHSIASGVIAGFLEPYAPPLDGDLFTTGLLHDVGKIVLSDFVGGRQAEIEALVAGNACSFSEAETRVLGLSHAEVGARILEKWNFPPVMVEAVRYHHEPNLVPDSPLAHFTALTATLAVMLGYATDQDGLSYRGFSEIYARYGLSEPILETILAESLARIQTVEAELVTE